MEYRVVFSGYFNYVVEVDADTEDEAIDIAERDFDNADPSEFDFETENVEALWEE